MDAMTASMQAMMATEYDPNEFIPLPNRKATMFGATIPFHILSWAAVCFRLYTRFRVVREPGLDDYFIIAAAVINLACLVATLDCIQYGLGLHVGQILKPDGSGMGMMIECMKRGYVQNATYLACSGIIKMSLLFQYLRIFKEGKTRRVCQFMLLLTVIWSIIGFVQGWFPCFPASGFWDRQQTPTPKCWGLGFGELQSARMALYGFAASNMVLDAIIFAIPTSVYWQPGIGRKEVMALTALFSLGAIVVLMAVLRLWAIARHDDGASNMFAFDFTWWFPLTLIFSALEIDFAIITASIPIFWPVIARSLPQIFVTQEIHVTHHSNNDFEMGRPQSLKSNNSQEGLTRVLTAGAKNNFTDYSNSFVSEPIPPNRIEIGGKEQKAWGGR